MVIDRQIKLCTADICSPWINTVIGTRRFGAETMLFVRLKNDLAKNPRAVESMSWKDVNTYREV